MASIFLPSPTSIIVPLLLASSMTSIITHPSFDTWPQSHLLIGPALFLTVILPLMLTPLPSVAATLAFLTNRLGPGSLHTRPWVTSPSPFITPSSPTCPHAMFHPT